MVQSGVATLVHRRGEKMKTMRYTAITIEQMREHLRADKGWYEPPHTGHEHVFQVDCPFWPGVVVKVFTSINKDNGNGRRKGGDVIKVCAVDLRNVRGLHRSIRVLRVEGWRDNLKKAVATIWHDLKRRAPAA